MHTYSCVKKRVGGASTCQAIEECTVIIISFQLGFAMMKKLPHSKFEWIKTLPSVEELARDPKGNTGCFLEVDTDLPPEIHYSMMCFVILVMLSNLIA